MLGRSASNLNCPGQMSDTAKRQCQMYKWNQPNDWPMKHRQWTNESQVQSPKFFGCRNRRFYIPFWVKDPQTRRFFRILVTYTGTYTGIGSPLPLSHLRSFAFHYWWQCSATLITSLPVQVSWHSGVPINFGCLLPVTAHKICKALLL